MKRLVKDRRGAAALEFTLAVLPYMALVLILLDAAMAMHVHATLEGAVRSAARAGITGYVGEDGRTREQRILDLLSQRTLGMIRPETARVETRVYARFADVREAEPFQDGVPGNGTWDPGETFVDYNGNGVWDDDPGMAGIGQSGDIVAYRVYFRTLLISPVLNRLLPDAPADRLFRATAVVRNEPW